MKKIIGLTIAALLIIGMVGAGTWAYFSDTEESTGNTFTAGSLDLNPYIEGTGPGGKTTVNYYPDAGNNEIFGNVVFDNLVPGDSGSITWQLTNDGTIDGDFLVAALVETYENTELEPEGTEGNNGDGDGDLDEYLEVRISRGGIYLVGSASTYGPLELLEGALDEDTMVLAANGGQVTYLLEWQIDGGVGNVIMSDSAEIDLTFTLDQIP